MIVSKEFTASDLIEKNRLAIITDNYDEAILDRYLHHGRIAGMVERGREYVKNNLSWDSFGKKMLDAYTAAL